MNKYVAVAGVGIMVLVIGVGIGVGLKIKDVSISNSEAVGPLPVAVISALPPTGSAPLTVTFDGSQSYDPDGSIVSYQWYFGDGTYGSGVSVSHTYTGVQTYSPSLIVTDNNLQQSLPPTYTSIVTTTNPGNKSPIASYSTNPPTGSAPLTVTFDGSQSSDPDGTIVKYVWGGSGMNGETTAVVVKTYTTPGSYCPTLTVTDNGGITDNYIKCVVVTTGSASINTPSDLTATANNKVVTLKWKDNSNNEEGFYIERAANIKNPVYQKVGEVTANSVQFSQTVTAANYIYRIQAFNSTTNTLSNYSNLAKIRVR
jgi:thermitase